jgi:hypothetical protein
MSIATFIEVLLLLVVALIACTGLVLLVDQWRARKLHRHVRAYEGLGDSDWLSLPTARPEETGEEGGTPGRT